MNQKTRVRILARHKWVLGTIITESVLDDDTHTLDTPSIRRFTATIRGWRNWKIYQGPICPQVIDYVITTVRAIRDRIDEGDDTVFNEPNKYATTFQEGDES